MFIFNVKPMGAVRMTRADSWKDRDVVVRYNCYKSDMQKRAFESRFTVKNVIDLIFLIPMPDSWSMKKKIAVKGTPNFSRPDTDNLIKAFCDALMIDDSKVWDMRGRKYWWDSGATIVLNNDVTENADAPYYDPSLVAAEITKIGLIRGNDIV